MTRTTSVMPALLLCRQFLVIMAVVPSRVPTWGYGFMTGAQACSGGTATARSETNALGKGQMLASQKNYWLKY